MILAGIVLFNPSIERLRTNIQAVKTQVDRVILIDNGSENEKDIDALIKKDSQISVYYNHKNMGIAYALNEIFEFAKNNGFHRVLTLDQDSVVADNIIDEYERYFDENQLLMLSCRIQDRNFILKNDSVDGIIELKTAITSGSYTSVEVWETVGRFDDVMFIDFVDNDFCYRLKKNGGKIIRIGSTYILHELGHSRIVHPLGVEQVVYNHSSFRCYYMIRNRLYFGRKHLGRWDYLRNVLAVFLRFSLIIIYESDKKSKFLKMIDGVKDGFSMKIS